MYSCGMIFLKKADVNHLLKTSINTRRAAWNGGVRHFQRQSNFRLFAAQSRN